MAETPEPSERGRYAIFEQPDGGLVIRRSTPLCKTCSECGCGEPQVQMEIPPGVVPMLQAYSEGGIPAVIKMMSQNGGGGMIKMAREARRRDRV